MRVKIYGAGSIGNHLAQASRRQGWEVCIVDPDAEALKRTREQIYPMRYGAWDEAIELFKLGEEPKGGFDIIYLGTPPHVRMDLALRILKENPKILQLEKPVCSPDLAGVGEFLSELSRHPETKVVVGYEYLLAKFANRAKEILASGILGKPQTMDVDVREIWTGIFGAHPWLRGPQDTYLGFWQKGGGTTAEHSHAINLWQFFANAMEQGRITEVNANLQMVTTDKVDYDELCFMTVKTEKGFLGRVVQDVVTNPVRLNIRVQAEKGYLECLKGALPEGDLIKYEIYGESARQEIYPKKRPDDFFAEVTHINELVSGAKKINESPIFLERGLDTMLVVAAAHKSHKEKRTVVIDYSRGYCPEALQ